MKLAKSGAGNNALIFGLTFLPPTIIVLFYPGAFLRGLQYAGLSVVILMVLLPPLMAWRGRYHRELASDTYQVMGGKALLILLLLSATVMLSLGLEGTF